MRLASTLNRLALATFAAALGFGATPAAQAQGYGFGQNHVQYKKLDWRELETEHFIVHFYDEEREAAMMTARMAERSYARLSRIFNHEFREKKPIIVFASRGHFAQNNIFGDPGEGTGGFTDALRQRNVFFWVGDIRASEQVLAHEMVHQFQYDIFARGRGGLNAMGQCSPPLWFIEGMAEYLSIGPLHPATDAVIRDAAWHGNFPTLEDMTYRPNEYFPYRWGEALMAYVAQRWGDEVIGEVMQATPAVCIESALRRHTGLSLDELGEEWEEAVREKFLPPMAQKDGPRKFAQPILSQRLTGGSAPVFIAPSLSPDGRQIAFLSTGSFARAEVFMDLYLADATTGKRGKRLTKSTLDPEFEELRILHSQSAFSPDGRRIAFTAQREGRDVLYVLDLARDRRTMLDAGLDFMIAPSFSPDGRQIVFSGSRGGFSDLYIIDADGRNLRQLTSDPYGDHQPQWSPDGQRIVFASERGEGTDLEVLRTRDWHISVLDLASGEITVLPNQAGRNLNPMWAPDGQSVAFVSNRTGIANLFLYDFGTQSHYQLTDLVGSIMSVYDLSPAITWAREADRLAFVYHDDTEYTVWAVDNPRSLKKAPFQGPPVIVADASGDRPTEAGITPPTRATPPIGSVLSAAGDSAIRRLSIYRSGDAIRSADRPLPRRADGTTPGQGLSVKALLDSASLALPDISTFEERRYQPKLRAEYVSRPQLGYAQDNFGRGVYGGTTIYLRDMLGNRALALAGAVNGRLDEAEMLIDFVSYANRFIYGAGYQQAPTFILADATQRPVGDGQVVQTTAVARYIIREGYFNGAYPLNRFSRIEVGTSLLNVERAFQYLSRGVDYVTGYSTGLYVDSIVDRHSLTYVRPYVAYVTDNTLFGNTWSPIYGHRMRFQISPTFGGANWMQYSADYRRYDPILFNYLTLATRFQADLSIGGDEMEFPKYIGRPYFIRGYDREQYSQGDCAINPQNVTTCAATQLLGSRVAFANAELRFPILRRVDFGLLPLSLPPIEGLVFFDMGAAWSKDQRLYATRPDNYDLTRQRYFLSSHGFGVRVNAFNIAVIRWDYAIPHDGASRKGYWVWTIGSSY